MENIRNIALVGASGAGKTCLAEQMLFNAKTTTRVGKIEDGNTVMDYNAEEVEKGMSMVLGVANFNWKHTKINILDTPGYVDFSGEQIAAASAVENIIFVVNATAGFEVGFEQSLELLSESRAVKSLIINRMDNEGADFKKALELIRENTDLTPVPILLPIGSEHKFNGVVDIVKGKAFIDGQAADIPAELSDLVEENRMALMESVAESDDEL
nr:GTP-binding protein [Candidatus Cloacimonadota bacterium]